MVMLCLILSKTNITKRADTSWEVSALILFADKSFTGQQYFRIKTSRETIKYLR